MSLFYDYFIIISLNHYIIISLSICRSIYRSIYLAIYLSYLILSYLILFYLSIYPSIYLSIHVCMHTYIHTYTHSYLTISMYDYIHTCIQQPVYDCICISLSIYVYNMYMYICKMYINVWSQIHVSVRLGLWSALLSGRLKSLPSDGTSPTVWWMGNNGYMNHKKERFNYCNYTVDI